MPAPTYDVVIIGGGISGTALLYVLLEYTDLKRVALLEKYSSIAMVNTHGRNNSQTLHCGDIETNYTLEKAIHVRDTAKMLVNFTNSLVRYEKFLYRYPKMVLAVGEEECQSLFRRYQTFRDHFPAMQWLEQDGIEKVEPMVVKGRKERIAAIGILDEYTAVDFHQLSNVFVDRARQAGGGNIDILTSTRVKSIHKAGDVYKISTNQGDLQSRFVVVSAGGHSLLFAQRMGYGLNYACLPVAGSFYYTPKVLNGKVYTMQNDKLPFAAIHGDPDILVKNKTRFGPTALILPLLERYNWKTFPEFLQILRLDKNVLQVFYDLLKDGEIRRYLLKNMLFEVPLIRRRLFLRDARKIIPTLRLEKLVFAHRVGGIRPVMIDKQQKKLHLGEAKISMGDGIIFNMTPSPGATSCLGNAENDVRIIADYLGCGFDQDKFDQVLKK